jgi:hypothetical protein
VNCVLVHYNAGHPSIPGHGHWIVPGTYDDGEGNVDHVPN